MRRTEHYTFFFSKADGFSNWHPSRFEYRGIAFVCMEQFMMYAKARLFKDEEVAQRILATSDPAEHKKLGREVRNYVDAEWDAKRDAIVSVGLREKFAQNPRLLKELLSTAGTALVEASPYDRLWGIGVGMDDPRALDPTQWKGQNRLGVLLDKVRAHFLRLEASPVAAAPETSPAVNSVPTKRPPGAAFQPRQSR